MRLLSSEREEEGEPGIDGRGVREDASEERRGGGRGQAGQKKERM